MTSAAQSVLIVGGGTMGLASAWALTRSGAAVTVLERFGVVNAQSSHGGFTRVIRQAYHEGSDYVPLIRESEDAWLGLEERAAQSLLVRTGLLEFGAADQPELRAAIDVCDAMRVDYEVTDAATAMRRWPIVLPDDWIACLTPSGGYLRVRPCLEALSREAQAAGAIIREGARVVSIVQDRDGVGARLEDGTIMRADRVVVTAGPWLPDLLPASLRAGLYRLRRVLAWSDPQGGSNEQLRRLPVWGAFLPEGFFYGFPLTDEGVTGFKVACHTTFMARQAGLLDQRIDPEQLDRHAGPLDLDPLAGILKTHFPAAVGPWIHHAACMYTVTPSWDFLVDRLPDDPRIIVAGGFSGHGFKFAPAIGRLVAELVVADAPARSDFSFARHCADAATERG